MLNDGLSEGRRAVSGRCWIGIPLRRRRLVIIVCASG